MELVYRHQISRTCVQMKYNKKYEVVIHLFTSGYNEDELTSKYITFKLITNNVYLQSNLKDNSIAQIFTRT